MMQTLHELDKSTVRRTYEVLGGLFGMGAVVAVLSGLVVGALVSFDLGLATGFLAITAITLYCGWRLALLLIDIQDSALNVKTAHINKLNAEADALRGAMVVNVNNGSGTQKVINKPITYRVNGQVVNGNQLIQASQSDKPRRIEIPAADVLWTYEQLPVIGHAKGAWVGKQKLPYSGLDVTYLIYKTLIDPLAGTDKPAIVGRGERASGALVIDQPKELIKYADRAYPHASSKGIVLELPAKTS